MIARFLLGPAGAGKTFRCLAEIRAALRAVPEGPPLVFLAPKQATFQLERQLLTAPDCGCVGVGDQPQRVRMVRCAAADAPTLHTAAVLPEPAATPEGFTRLHILSFERLADFVLRQLNRPRPRLLSDEGRTMVLRALLARRRTELRIFQASAGLEGFATQLSEELRELQRHQMTPARLDELAASPGLASPLRHKLHDLRLVLGEYLDWLERHELQDSASLLDIAAEALREASPAQLRIAALWMDGFAEMSPQELDLLAALAPCCGEITLAFCLDEADARRTRKSWLSIWSGLEETRGKCWARLAAIPGCQPVAENLARNPQLGRFAENPVSQHLELHWTNPAPAEFPPPVLTRAVRLVECPNAEAEAVLAAREVLRLVRAGGRYRDAAVLVRQLEPYQDAVRRVFARYEIPYFLDQRESVSHHPLAELTRAALRVVLFDWRHDDWFGALKTGLVSGETEAIDHLENESLAHGWKGEAWLQPLIVDGHLQEDGDRLRKQWVAPFLKLKRDLLQGSELRPSGQQLAEGLRAFWMTLAAEETLGKWAGEDGFMGNSSQPTHQPPSVHATVWDQLNGWLDNIALAFGDHSLPLREWLPILEAGLGKLTVGVIPPALDQVLVGAIDRSRNPDLKLAILPGLNESVFPAVVAANRLLTESDREELEGCGLVLGQESRRLLARERFLGYIACTRARERLVLSWSRRDARDRTLNRSPFVSQLQVLLPALAVEEFAPPADFAQVEHACELPGVPGHPFSPSPPTAVGGEGRREEEQLPPTQVEQLYGATLKTSVSRIEKFAACPFKFFVESGLRAEERKRFEVNTREIGDFQHEVLRLFHQQLHDQGKRWRDLAPAEARVRVAKIASELAAFFREGLFKSDAQARFTAQALGQSLGQFVATAVEWMATYAFDPVAVELAFDPKLEALPAWEMDLGEGHRLLFRGRIDRIDLCSIPGADAALAVVIDYKSGARKLDPLLLENGLQMQLPAYLAVLRQFPEPRAQFGVGRLVPAGVFYVNLRGQYQDGATRDEVLPQLDAARRRAYRHLGRFDLSRLASLDHRGASEGEQFSFKLTKEGKLDKRSTDPMSSEAFTAFLDQVEEHLRRMGREIFAGVIRPDPYQKGAERACDNCDFKAICRIDPWTHSFRQLRIGSGEVRIKN